MDNPSSQDGDRKTRSNVNLGRNGQPYVPTPQEQEILDDWRKNSFLRGGLHGATGLLFGVWTGRMFKSMTKRTQTFIAGAMGTLGFMNGVRSYTATSFEKLMALEDSPLGDEVRRSMESAKSHHESRSKQHGLEHRHPQQQQLSNQPQVVHRPHTSTVQDNDGWSAHAATLDDSGSKNRSHITGGDWDVNADDVEHKLHGGSRYKNFASSKTDEGWDVNVEDVEHKLHGGSRYGNPAKPPADEGWGVNVDDVEHKMTGPSRYGNRDRPASAHPGPHDRTDTVPSSTQRHTPNSRSAVRPADEASDTNQWWGATTAAKPQRATSIFGAEFDPEQQEDGTHAQQPHRGITYDELRLRRRQQQKEHAAAEE
eukprot:m.280896 g.280896  ORF g.280896 m.280896 type:complete len:368 (-) comp19831_c0_seq2:518-1621(-)